jgi:hypothetical protein
MRYAAIRDAHRCDDFPHQASAARFRQKPGLRQDQGTYTCSFHDASWLDYLRLPHSLSLSALDEVAEFYWSGRTVEEIGLTFMNEPWQEPPVIERSTRAR